MTLEKPTHSLQYILTLLIYCLASTTSAQVQFSREAVTAEIYHIDSIADTEFQLNNYSLAASLAEQAANLARNIWDTLSPGYISLAGKAAAWYEAAGQHKKGLHWGLRALACAEWVWGNESSVYANLQGVIAGCLNEMGNYVEATRQGENAAKNAPDDDLELRSRLYTDEALYLRCLGNYSEAVNWIKKAITLANEYDSSGATAIIPSALLADCYYLLGRYDEAIDIGSKVLNMRQKKIGGASNHDIAMSLTSMAVYWSGVGDFEEAIRIGNLAVETWQKQKDTSELANALSNMADFHMATGNVAQAIALGEQALALRGQHFGTNHPDYATSLLGMADYYAASNNHQKAIDACNHAVEIRARHMGSESIRYALALTTLSKHLFLGGNIQQSAQYALTAFNIQHKSVGIEHPESLASLMLLTNIYANSADSVLELMSDFATLGVRSLTSMVRKSLTTLSSHERTLLWDKYKKWVLHDLNRAAQRCIDTPFESQMAETACNASIFAKGILLGTELEMRQLLYEGHNEQIVSDFDTLKAYRLALERLYVQPPDQRTASVDSIERLADALERKLIRESKQYVDYVDNISTDWKSISKKLSGDEAAIEFVCFDINNDSVQYTAYVFRNNSTAPQIIRLMKVHKHCHIARPSIYTSPSLSSLLWATLSESLHGINRIFFSPAGELYNIAIESLPDWEKKEAYVNDRWQLYRLSSLRELLFARQHLPFTSAAVFGGIHYDTDSIRTGIPPLPGTDIESKNITTILKQNNIDTKLYHGDSATEHAFRNLTGNNIQLLHIATHGFYIDSKGLQHNRFAFMPQIYVNGLRHSEDIALSHSGLLMAHVHPTKRNNDGVLTAKEISLLDLRTIDLAVLSACQTGIGDIDGEGVFGLQRGFKKAGVQSMLLSLWKVNDHATQLLMQQFYANLMAGMNCKDALNAAQHFLREYTVSSTKPVQQSNTKNKRWRHSKQAQPNTHPYNNPRFWAAFVLLDSIE